MLDPVCVERLWPGSVIACVASGPSLTREDVERVHGRMPVIAVNDAVQYAPWANVLYSSDRQWWPLRQGVPEFQGLRYGMGNRAGNASPFPSLPDVQVLRNTGDEGLEFDPRGLRTGRNSGYAAINLAVHLGASCVVLLGYDMGRVAGRSHFFGEHKGTGLMDTSDDLYKTFRRMYRTMVVPLREAKVLVVNCTPNSRLEVFPRVTLDEVFEVVPC